MAAPGVPAPVPVPVSAPPRVVAALADAPDQDAVVVHRSSLALHVRIRTGTTRRVVGVVAPGGARLPTVVRAVRPLPPGSVRVRSGCLELGGVRLTVGRIVDVGVPRVHGVAERTFAPLCDLPLPREPEIARRLLGRGPGLTPLGDDVVVGWLAAHRAAGVPTPELDAVVTDSLGATTEVSGALLEAALDGEVADAVRGHLLALGTPQEDSTLGALLRLGHTSGTGLAHGLHGGLRAVAGHAAEAA